MKTAFFDAKNYDVESFEKVEHDGIEFKFFETKLGADTVGLAKGFDAVCVFVNDDVSADVIDALYRGGVKVVA